jgi:NADH-quinone oxidoreductase subunit A
VLGDYAFLGMFAIAAMTFPLAPLIIARLIRPRKPTPIKQSGYECGLEVVGDIRVQFKVQYYLYALAFVIFDIEVVYIYPWALAYNQVGLFALVTIILFILLFVESLVYAWRKGALEWL